MTRLPQRPRSHILEDESRKFIKDIFPAEWIIDNGQSDYGIDLVVEIVENGNVTGAHFLVQLKSTDNIKTRKGDFISHSCRSSTLRYFLERPEPIIYLVYDANKKRGYWIWIQDYIRNKLPSKWREQTTTTIRIPKTNMLTEKSVSQIKAKVFRAHKQAKLLSTIQTLDNPFIRYELKTSENTDVITAFSKYPGADEDNPICFDFKFRFDESVEGQQAYQSLQDTFKRGSPAEISGKFIEEIQFPESFNPEIFSDDIVKFEKLFIVPIKRDRKFVTKIEVLDKEGKAIAQIPFVEFKEEYFGSEEVFVSNEEQHLPVKISMKFNLIERKINISFRFNIVGLNAFQVKEALEIQRSLATGTWIHILSSTTNTTLVKDMLPANLLSEPPKELLDLADKLAFIQEKTNFILSWPAQVSYTEIGLIDKIVTIIDTGKSSEGYYCEFGVDKIAAEKLAEAFSEHERLNLRQESENRVAFLFGQEISLGPATVSMPAAKPNEETMKRFSALDKLPNDTVVKIELDVGEPGVMVNHHRWATE